MRVRLFARAACAGTCVFCAVAAYAANGYTETDLVVNQQVNGVPTLRDGNGVVHVARFFDPNLVNSWGLTASATSPFWVSDNGASLATLYNTQGTPQRLVVSIPAPGDPLHASGTPTGAVFNTASAHGAFKLSGVNSAGNPVSAPALFLFASEDGAILGWNPNVNPAGFDPAKAGTYAIVAVDRSPGGAVYKGLAIATDANGAPFLYATNFHAGTVDRFDASFQPVMLSGAFEDPHLLSGYAPFNVALIGGTLFVSYAVQDEAMHDDVAGQGHGIVDTFDLEGHMLQRFAQHGQLDSPWGMALAPSGFGEFGGKLWIGNFGNGHINAYDPATGRFIGKVRDSRNQAIVIEGLWALRFGNGGSGGDANTLYFTAGPNDEADGLFGSISPN